MITTRTLNPEKEAATYKAFFMQGLVAELGASNAIPTPEKVPQLNF